MKRREKKGRFTSIWMVVVTILFLAGTTFGQPDSLLINLNQTYINLAPGHTAYIGYTVILMNGTAWPTSISVPNLVGLSQAGLEINFSPSSGIPPFRGIAAISASSSGATGTFSVVLLAIGINQTSKPAAFLVNIAAQSLSNAIATGTTTITSSSAPGGSKNQPNINLLYLVAIAIAVVIIVVLVAIRFVKRKPKVGGGDYGDSISIGTGRPQDGEAAVGEPGNAPGKTQ